MEREIFERVWDRVRGAQSRPPRRADPQRAALEGFIAGEGRDAAFYRALARRCSGDCRAEALRAARDEERHRKALGTEYYLLYGDSFLPRCSAPETAGVLSAARRAAVEEEKGAAAYRRAAGETQSPRLRALYESLARDEERHAAVFRRLVAQALR